MTNLGNIGNGGLAEAQAQAIKYGSANFGGKTYKALTTNSNEGDLVAFRDTTGNLLSGVVKTVVISFFFGGSYAIVDLDETSRKVADTDLIQALVLDRDRQIANSLDAVPFGC